MRLEYRPIVPRRLWPYIGCVAVAVLSAFISPHAANAQANGDTSEANAELIARRVEALRQQIGSIDEEIDDLEGLVAAAEQRIEELMRQLEAIELPEPEVEAEEPDEDEPTEVTFRPPKLEQKELNTPIIVVCKGGRIRVLDWEAARNSLNLDLAIPDRVDEFLVSGGDYAAMDFEIQIRIVEEVYLEIKAADQPNKPGETIERALRRRSRFLNRLDQCTPGADAIQFFVYPDSFAEFRQLRKEVWDRRFDVGWEPMTHGEEIQLGLAGAIGVMQ